MKNRRILVVALAGFLAVIPLLAERQDGMAVLGTEGETYLLKSGLYGELFPEGDATASENAVLALEILRVDEEPERYLVPHTEGAQAEGTRHLVYEDASGTLYVFWTGWTGGHPMIKLASFGDGLWSEVIDVSSDPWSQKDDPQLRITRDTLEIQDDAGQVRTISRTILHVTWWEELLDGGRAVYRPVILLDGVYQDTGSAYVLNNLVSGEDTQMGSTTDHLVRHPVIFPGRDEWSVIFAFVDAVTGHLMTVDLQVMPGDLGIMADAIRAHIIETGHRMNPRELGEVIRAHIIETGHRMNPRDLGFLADLIRAHIIETGHRYLPGDVGPYAGVIRAHIIETGVHLGQERHLASSAVVTPNGPMDVLEITSPADEEAGQPAVSHLIGLSPILELPVPGIEEGQSWLYPSRDGRQVILAWLKDGVLLYREADGGTGRWGETHSVSVTEDMPLEKILELLEARVNQ